MDSIYLWVKLITVITIFSVIVLWGIVVLDKNLGEPSPVAMLLVDEMVEKEQQNLSLHYIRIMASLAPKGYELYVDIAMPRNVYLDIFTYEPIQQ